MGLFENSLCTTEAKAKSHSKSISWIFLAGRLGSSTSQSGIILVNGHKQALAYGTSVCMNHLNMEVTGVILISIL